jgi:hypothetical protein
MTIAANRRHLMRILLRLVVIGWSLASTARAGIGAEYGLSRDGLRSAPTAAGGRPQADSVPTPSSPAIYREGVGRRSARRAPSTQRAGRVRHPEGLTSRHDEEMLAALNGVSLAGGDWSHL